jgi:hypothetical protein
LFNCKDFDVRKLTAGENVALEEWTGKILILKFS